MRIIILYLAIGGLLAVLADRRFGAPSKASRATAALLCVVAWPLFAPLTWLPSRGVPESPRGALAQHIERVLLEARGIVAGGALDDLLPHALMEHLLTGLKQVDQRHTELRALLDSPEFRSAETIAGVEGAAQLHAMYARDEATLQELGVLADTLKARLLVAHYSNRHVGGAPASLENSPELKDLALELTARVDSLAALFDLDSETQAVDTAKAR